MEETNKTLASDQADLSAFIREQESHNRKMQRLMKLAAGCMAGVLAVAVIAAVLVLPPVLGLLRDAGAVTTQAQAVLEDAQQIVVQVQEADPKALMESVDRLAREGETAVKDVSEQITRAVDILDKMDIASLNTAVDNLGKAVAPLAKLFGSR